MTPTVPDARGELGDALGRLDVAFAPVGTRPVTVGGCGHCYAEADLAALAGPVDAVPEDLVTSFAHKSPDHWADFPGLYRRLTPRIVRLLVAGRLDNSLVATRLLAAEWRGWPEPQRAALEQVWHAWWRSTLDAHPGAGHVTDVVETLAVTTGTLTPWLTYWAATRTEAADRHLNDTLAWWLVEDELADLHLGFYDEYPATPELLPWFLTLGEARICEPHLRTLRRIAEERGSPS